MKTSKYEYYEGPINNNWNEVHRGAFSLPSPLGRLSFLLICYLIIIIGFILLFTMSFPKNLKSLLLITPSFVFLYHNPIWFISYIQIKLMKRKKNINFYDVFIIKCNYFLEAKNIATKIGVERIYPNPINPKVIFFLDRRKKSIKLKGVIKNNLVTIIVKEKNKVLGFKHEKYLYEFSYLDFFNLIELYKYFNGIIKSIKNKY